MDSAITLEQALTIHERPAYVQNIDQSKTAASLSGDLNAQKNEAQQARARALLDTATGLGLKLGLSWQLNNINAAIHKRERELDTVYDFGVYMIQDRVVPPVISEMRDVYSQDGEFTLRLSGAAYKIESHARFSSVAPSWREYLTFPKPQIDAGSLVQMVKPRDDTEQTVWRVAIQEGWKQGVEQANIMLTYNFDLMNRDLDGMLRFHTFVRQGKITMPAIAYESIEVTKTGDVMAIDERLLRITTLSEFNGSIQSWKSTITMSPNAAPVLLLPKQETPAKADPAGEGI